MAEKHTILGGKVHVYQRAGSPAWQCATYLDGENPIVLHHTSCNVLYGHLPKEGKQVVSQSTVMILNIFRVSFALFSG